MLRGLLFFLIACASVPAAAEPTRYALDLERSSVTLFVEFNGADIKVDLPIEGAEISLDLKHVAASHVALTMRADEAKASIPFVASKLRGPPMLSAERYPVIRFDSTALRYGDGVTTIDGDVEIRGKVRPVALSAKFYRPARASARASALIIRLEGSVNRHDFGASGMRKSVGDDVEIVIEALINPRP